MNLILERAGYIPGHLGNRKTLTSLYNVPEGTGEVKVEAKLIPI